MILCSNNKYLVQHLYINRKKIDDGIDALSLAVMGSIILVKGLRTIPKNPMPNSKGILMQMVFVE